MLKRPVRGARVHERKAFVRKQNHYDLTHAAPRYWSFTVSRAPKIVVQEPREIFNFFKPAFAFGTSKTDVVGAVLMQKQRLV